MKRQHWILVGFLAMPLSATAGLFGFGDNSADVATKVATLDEDGEILGLDFSPDGKHLAATPFNSATVHIWDWQGNNLERTLKRDTGTNVAVTQPVRYSPDGKLLVVCHTRNRETNIVARIWNSDTWNVVHDIVEPGSYSCEAMEFLLDGKSSIRVMADSVWGYTGDNIIVYDTSSWEIIWKLNTQQFLPSTLALSPDNKLVAISGEEYKGGKGLPITIQGKIAIVDMAQHNITHTITINNGKRGALAWSPDGVHLAYENKDGVEIFDARTGVRVIEEKKESDRSDVHVRYTPDGKYLIESDFGKGGTRVRIWDGQHQKLLQEIKAIPGCIAVSRDGRFLAMGGNAPSITDINPLLSLMFPSKGKIVVYELK